MRLCPVSAQIDPDCFASERILVEVVFEVVSDDVRRVPMFSMLPSGEYFEIPEIDAVTLKGGKDESC